jgi:hypothetical protein
MNWVSRTSRILLAVAWLAALLLTSPLGAGAKKETDPGSGHTPITICHATSSKVNPYQEITVDDDATKGGHGSHEGDLIPAPANGCPAGQDEEPTAEPTADPGDGGVTPITICHATSSKVNPYQEITVDDDATKGGHGSHEGDLIPAPADGCPAGQDEEPTTEPTAEPTAEPTKETGSAPAKVQICHATGSQEHPYQEITVDDDATKSGHGDHEGDLIPAPAEGCLVGEVDPRLEPTQGSEPTTEPTPDVTPETPGDPSPVNTPAPTATPTLEPVASPAEETPETDEPDVTPEADDDASFPETSGDSEPKELNSVKALPNTGTAGGTPLAGDSRLFKVFLAMTVLMWMSVRMVYVRLIEKRGGSGRRA